MPPPVITNVYRVTYLWNQNDGITPRNVIHVRGATTPTATQVGTAVLAANQLHQWKFVSNGWNFTQVEVLPLDGFTAGAFVTTSATGGEATGDAIPAQAAVVSMRTGHRGSSGRGRVYLGPTTEDSQANGLLNTTSVAQCTTAWNGFLAALASGTPSLELVVASYKHQFANTVTSIFCEVVAATQRRRQSQLRGG